MTIVNASITWHQTISNVAHIQFDCGTNRMPPIFDTSKYSTFLIYCTMTQNDVFRYKVMKTKFNF